MSGLTPYLQFDGTARAALGFYRDVFGGELVVHSFADFGRQDGLGDAVAHGILHGRVELFAADVPPGRTLSRCAASCSLSSVRPSRPSSSAGSPPSLMAARYSTRWRSSPGAITTARCPVGVLLYNRCLLKQ